MLSATIVEFNKVEPSAAKLLLPYFGWALYASGLTYNIWANNTDKKVRPERHCAIAGLAASRLKYCACHGIVDKC